MSEVAISLDFFYDGLVEDDDNNNKTHPPRSFLLHPVFEHVAPTVAESGNIEGAVVVVLEWHHYLENILAEDRGGFVVVFRDTCGSDAFTYEVNGANPTFLGYGDRHDPKYGNMVQTTKFAPFDEKQLEFSSDTTHCEYFLYMYPSKTLEDGFRTNTPLFCALAMSTAFLVTMVVFAVYDVMVIRRQQKIAAFAHKANAVIASLFPAIVRDRVMEE